CPVGGVWSEWVVTGECPVTCGACGIAIRRRTCTTLCGACPCVGNYEDMGPCGRALCPFPAPKTGTCCKPFKKSLNHRTGQFFCGRGSIPALEC
ncbi:hypothetical protein PENTCL1PPCAC_14012, partial [Pristionchus entomophagus]